jgi:hypothetical protein
MAGREKAIIRQIPARIGEKMTLQKDIIDLFWKAGWAQYRNWVYYTAITRALNGQYLQERKPLKKGSTIERVVRMLASEGKQTGQAILESDGRGNFRWRQPQFIGAET